MSTGDQTEYVRGKLAQRGSYPAAKFMRDGFDEWAESETPARVGQMEKEPAETQMANYGGAMNLSKAKRVLYGGMSDRRVGGAIEVPEVVQKAINEAKKLINLWRSVSSWLDAFMSDLQDQIIDDPESSADLVKVATTILQKLKDLKAYKDILDDVASLAGSVGLGRNRSKLRGGAITIADVGNYAQQIGKLYGWFSRNKKNLTQILRLKSLQPYGKQLLDAVNPIFALVGLGGVGQFETRYVPCTSKGLFGECVGSFETRKVGGRKKSDECCCDSMHGGMMSAGQYEKAARATRISGAVSDAVAEGAMLEARRQAYKQGTTAKKALQAAKKQAEEATSAAVAAAANAAKKSLGPSGKGRRRGGQEPERVLEPGMSWAPVDIDPRMYAPRSKEEKEEIKRALIEAKLKYGSRARVVGGAFPWEGEYYAQPAMGVRMGVEEPYMLPPRGDEPTAQQKKRIEEELADFQLERDNMEEMGRQMGMEGRRIGGRKAPSARGAIVKQVMREHGLSLPQASKFVKEHGLY
jgi:hypothetical protein